MNKVSIIRCDDYDNKKVRVCLEKTFEHLGGLGTFVTPGMQVALKPNLVMPRKPESATTTHPVLVQELAGLLDQAGAHVTLVESPGGPYVRPALKKVYSDCGMTNLIHDNPITLNYDLSFSEKENPQGYILKKIALLKPLLDADLVINLPKLKTHGMMVYTGAIKNLYGAIPGFKKTEYHMHMADYNYFAHALIDIFLAINPGLTIMDAIVGMDGHGPSSGNPKKLGFLAAAQNAFDLDLACAHIIRVDPDAIPVLNCALKRGLRKTTIHELEIIGDTLESVRCKTFKHYKTTDLTAVNYLTKGFIRSIADKIKPKPVISRKKCLVCGICAQNCPAHIISLEDTGYNIALEKCIRCFCCHELCPHKAITIKRYPKMLTSFVNLVILILAFFVPGEKQTYKSST